MVLEKWRIALGDPGQLYNTGNWLVLAGGIGGAIFAAIGEGAELGGAAASVAQHFFGTPAAVALTGATLVFITGGAAYSRAWRNGGATPDAYYSRLGDILSGVGAVILGVGLALLGDAMLALFAGLLHAGGKLGSAFAGERRLHLPFASALLADICKDAVLISRLPALLAAFSGLLATMMAFGPIGQMVLALSVTVGTIYWALADILLLRRDGPLMSATRRIVPGRDRPSTTK